MTDRYERIRDALEGLRERCAQEAERITARRRTIFALANNEEMRPCEVAAAIRKIDVQQYYEYAVREIERLAKALNAYQMGLRYAVRVWVLSDEIVWSEETIDEAVENIIDNAKKEASND